MLSTRLPNRRFKPLKAIDVSSGKCPATNPAQTVSIEPFNAGGREERGRCTWQGGISVSARSSGSWQPTHRGKNATAAAAGGKVLFMAAAAHAAARGTSPGTQDVFGAGCLVKMY